ncbi:hypothetical protein K432DRAFT_385394 [Lepidopterella palustris CBS 459.81]|uniref:Uncharacterized protein n=1 Tax=Lepidopterella palustris CBS 459.81 TaxID=1314670 RepID=A0A8E2JBI4_9PEZI|nr:hypothetical protein K432DRAFT_385394 [Lepidopterella palustris CBS 459.81]
MCQRRAIACTICANAKTKSDKAVPSCFHYTAKGLACEARSTRRATDNVNRQAKKQLVSHKKSASTPSLPTLRSENTSDPSRLPPSSQNGHSFPSKIWPSATGAIRNAHSHSSPAIFGREC